MTHPPDHWECQTFNGFADKTFDTFVTEDPAVSLLKKNLGERTAPLLVHGPRGNGVTHLLMAICREWKMRFPGQQTASLTAESLLYFLRHTDAAFQRNRFRNSLLEKDLLVIDNCGLLCKSSRGMNFLAELIRRSNQENKCLVLGGTDSGTVRLRNAPDKQYPDLSSLHLPLLKPHLIYRILKEMCLYEKAISTEQLLHTACFSAPVQKHLDFLLALRFRKGMDCGLQGPVNRVASGRIPAKKQQGASVN